MSSLFLNAFYYSAFAFSLVPWFFYLAGLFYSPSRFLRLSSSPVKYFALIPAHNEGAVIYNSVSSLFNAGFSDVWVVADSCIDNTTFEATRAGASVIKFTYRNKFLSLRSAVRFLLSVSAFPSNSVIFFFDADNLVPSSFLSSLKGWDINGAVYQHRFCSTSFSVLSRLYAFMYSLSFQFLRGYMVLSNNSRSILAGTSFSIPYKFLSIFASAKVFSLIDDFELSTVFLLSGVPVRFLDVAYSYNQVPSSWSVARHQRLRWSRGFVQMLRYRFKVLLRFPVFLFLALFVPVVASLVGSVVLSFFSLKGLGIYLVIWSMLGLSLLQRPDYFRFFDVFLLPYFFLENVLIFIVACFTFDNFSWFSTPHFKYKSDKFIGFPVLRG